MIVVNTWHHITHREAYIKKLMRALKPMGEIYVVDFQPGKGGPGPGDHHRLKAFSVFMELKKAGLQSSVIYEKLPYQYMVRGKKSN